MLIQNTGLSSIKANQAALATIANNIANAGTDGYHRQRVNFSESVPFANGSFSIGTGVNISGIERLANAGVDNSLTLNQSQTSAAQAELSALEEIERLLTPSSGSLHDSASKFFDSIEQLSANPTEPIKKQNVLAAAQGVAQALTAIHSGLDALQQDQEAQLQAGVKRVNELTSAIADINADIRAAKARGGEPATLLDQKGLLLNELASYVDLSPQSLVGDSDFIIAAGGSLGIGNTAPQLTVQRNADGQLEILLPNDLGTLEPVSGSLAAQLNTLRKTIPEARASLDEWSQSLIAAADEVQATGLPESGGFSSLVSTRSVSDPNVPLAQADPLFPINAGELFVTTTDSATGERKLQQITIDPEQDSLNDIVARLEGLSNVSASLSQGTLRITADAGYTFDFAALPPTNVDVGSITGTVQPTIDGVYSGQNNADLVFTAESNGEIGVTPGLSLKVTDANTGDVLGRFPVGAGYQAHQPIELGNGLTLTLTSGTLNAGDQFTVPAVSDSDTSGMLAALGVNSLFQTNDLRTIRVNPALIQDIDSLVTSRTGAPADGTHLLKLTQLRDAAIVQGETLEERLASLTSASGLAVNSTRSQASQLSSQYEQLRSQQDSVSGVDPNEELLLMMEFQRSFQATAQFMSSINQTLDDLLPIIR